MRGPAIFTKNDSGWLANGLSENEVNMQIIILGTNGNCIDILDTINEIAIRSSTDSHAVKAQLECIGFLDDDAEKWGKEILGVKVLGPINTAANYDAMFVNGIGSPGTFHRKPEIIARAGVQEDRWATVIHPTASVSRTASIGKGTVIFQNVTVTSNAVIGDHVVILPNSVISHDAQIGDYTCIAGGVCVSGNVRVGMKCYLGTNSAIINNITIGEMSLIGMGSVVLKDVPENTVVAGNPARELRRTMEIP